MFGFLHSQSSRSLAVVNGFILFIFYHSIYDALSKTNSRPSRFTLAARHFMLQTKGLEEDWRMIIDGLRLEIVPCDYDAAEEKEWNAIRMKSCREAGDIESLSHTNTNCRYNPGL
jgi:hypothetical protein